jgi:hypothetical protein
MKKMDNNIKSVLEEGVANIAVSLSKQKPEEEKEPSKIALTVVGVAAFVMLSLLDLIAAILVGSLTNWLYALATFFVGVGSLSVAWVGHFYPYAGKWQKIISTLDMIISISSTLFIGILAAIVNASIYFNALSGDLRGIFEVILLVSLVAIGVLHAVAFVAYVFSDEVAKRYQRNMANKANHAENLNLISMAEERTAAVIKLANDLQQMIDSGQGDVLREQIKNITGDDYLDGIVSGANSLSKVNQYQQVSGKMSEIKQENPTRPLK